MRRIFGASILGVLLVASACASGPSGAQTYSVGVDAASPEGKNFQYSAFFPSTLKASPGDTIVFKNNSTQAPHTVSFGIDERRSNQPPVILPDGTESPVVQQPCYTENPPTAQLVECPSKSLPAFNGEGYWNSGFLLPAPAPAQAGPKEVTLKLADDMTPGSYRYVCILHGPMAGVLNVLEAEGDRDEKEVVAENAADQLKDVQDDANGIEDPQTGLEGDTFKAAAGWGGDSVTAVNRFLPKTIEVKAGQKVSWEAFSAYEPHTVSFGAYQAGNAQPDVFGPKGTKSGGSYAGGDANSGIFGPKGGPFPAGPFTLTFPNAGEYKYVCVLHPGMAGIVKVT